MLKGGRGRGSVSQSKAVSQRNERERQRNGAMPGNKFGWLGIVREAVFTCYHHAEQRPDTHGSGMETAARNLRLNLNLPALTFEKRSFNFCLFNL